jgi:hypothetical protein
MTSPRSLVTLVAVLALLAPALPAHAHESGGVAVQSFDEAGGGIVAPPLEAVPDEAPVADAAQDDTPTTPEGEEQPPDEQNGDDGTPPDEETPDTDDGDGAPPGDDGVSGGGSAPGYLPQTGLELAALSAIGLGLLLAGGALWPIGSWPPPRHRPSRSTPRR